LGLSIEHGLEPRQPLRPEIAIVGQPIGKRCQTLGTGLIIGIPTLAPMVDQMTAAQHAEMLRYCRLRNRKLPNQRIDRRFALRQVLKDRKTGGIGEYLKERDLFLRWHSKYISLHLYIKQGPIFGIPIPPIRVAARGSTREVNWRPCGRRQRRLYLDLDPQAGLADNGDLETDLTSLLEEVGNAARKAKTGIVLFIDELQYLRTDQFAALISALHRCAQLKLPLTLVGAGLPQLRALAGNAKSYAERLFDYPQIGALTPQEAEIAIVKPAQHEGVAFSPKAIARIVAETRGYPYFLQEWESIPGMSRPAAITPRDIEIASVQAIAALDESFFRVRFDRLTPAGKRYLRAMADLGHGPHRSGDIALVLDKPVNALGPLRQSLIAKGMIWSPNHGDTAFTVPLFDEFMRRIVPGSDWKSE
jgi:hypothetical protein